MVGRGRTMKMGYSGMKVGGQFNDLVVVPLCRNTSVDLHAYFDSFPLFLPLMDDCYPSMK
jgi:hypothetical protein